MVEPQSIHKGVYRHFKGGLYEVVDTVIDSETLKTMVLYRPLGTPYWWVRPYEMFCETVEHDGRRVLRFQLVEAR